MGLIDMMNGGGAGETCFKGKDVVFLHTGGVFGWYDTEPCPTIRAHDVCIVILASHNWSGSPKTS